MKETSIIVAGFGGQGILFLGRLLAYGGMLEGKEVTCFPSYGAEMRGGTANCTVIISDDMIGSPIVKKPDILIAMNEVSLRRFQPKIKAGGLLVFDSSLVKTPELRTDLRAVSIPASDIAAAEGQVKSSNMVIFGALIAITGILKEGNAIKALEKLISSKRKESLDGNRGAIKKGINYIADKKSTNS